MFTPHDRWSTGSKRFCIPHQQTQHRCQRAFLPLDDFFSVAAGRGMDCFYNDKVGFWQWIPGLWLCCRQTYIQQMFGNIWNTKLEVGSWFSHVLAASCAIIVVKHHIDDRFIFFADSVIWPWSYGPHSTHVYNSFVDSRVAGPWMETARSSVASAFRAHSSIGHAVRRGCSWRVLGK